MTVCKQLLVLMKLAIYKVTDTSPLDKMLLNYLPASTTIGSIACLDALTQTSTVQLSEFLNISYLLVPLAAITFGILNSMGIPALTNLGWYPIL